jgi:hypothetical protein
MDTSTPSYRVGVISMIQEEEDAILACFSAFFGDFELGRLTKFNDFPFRIYRPTTEFCRSGDPVELLYFHINAVGNVDAANITIAAIMEVPVAN